MNFRNGTPPSSPTSYHNVKRYQTGQILLISPYHKSWHRTPHCRKKILTSIQKNSHLSLVFCEGERHEREGCCESSCSNHTGIQKAWEMLGRGATALGADAHDNSINLFRQKAKPTFVSPHSPLDCLCLFTHKQWSQIGKWLTYFLIGHVWHQFVDWVSILATTTPKG